MRMLFPLGFTHLGYQVPEWHELFPKIPAVFCASVLLWPARRSFRQRPAETSEGPIHPMPVVPQV